MAVMFRLQCFAGETKWYPFQDDIFKWIFLYGIVLLLFFKFDSSAFLDFHTEIYCIIFTSCSERGSNAVHRIWRHYLETFSLMLVQCADHRAPWFPAQRASDTEIYLPAFNPFCPVLFAHIRQKTAPYPMTCWQWFGFVLAMCILA